MSTGFLSAPSIPVALCLGGVDPSGGAGLLRDAVTLAALGVHPMAVPLAGTVQNGLECIAIDPPGTNPVLSLEALRPHLTGVWGVKIGLSALDDEAFAAFSASLNAMAPPVRIWDPIMAPSVGVSHHGPERLRRMAQALLAGGAGDGWVVSPNLPEARVLADLPEGTSDPLRLAAPLLELGARAVWLKGGHGEGNLVEDFWITPSGAVGLGRFPRFKGERRGTGCTLAAGWLGHRLRGDEDVPAALAAAAWLRDHWLDAFTPGGVGRPSFAPGPVW